MLATVAPRWRAATRRGWPPPSGWAAGVTVRFHPFDLLCVGGVELRDRPWAERTDRVGELLSGGIPDGVQAMSSSADGPAMWGATAAIGAEGVSVRAIVGLTQDT